MCRGERMSEHWGVAERFRWDATDETSAGRGDKERVRGGDFEKAHESNEED